MDHIASSNQYISAPEYDNFVGFLDEKCLKNTNISAFFKFPEIPNGPGCHVFAQQNHFTFYARKQLLLSAHLSHCNSVCPSVCLSGTRMDQRRSKLGLPNLHRWLPGIL